MLNYNSPQLFKPLNSNNYNKVIIAAIILAISVILLGAYTRLTNAGLGCPDWPGCYGQIFVPHDVGSNNFGATWEFNATKAWTEMAHRYLAGSLGLLILFISFITIKNNHNKQLNFRTKALPFLLLATLFFQAALGMWTVTLKLLPTVVMGHLIGGLCTLSLLIIILLNNFKFNNKVKISCATKKICAFTLAMIVIQIILGGWTSSNYAALPCLDFPSCDGFYFPEPGTLNAMNPFLSIGPNYEGGLFTHSMRITIQLFHRWGALITSILVLASIANIKKYNYSYYNKFTNFLLALLTLQISLGIMNIKWALPVYIAVMHNGIAAVLLISFIILNYKIRVESREACI